MGDFEQPSSAAAIEHSGIAMMCRYALDLSRCYLFGLLFLLPNPRTHLKIFWQIAFRHHQKSHPEEMMMSIEKKQDGFL